MIYEGINKEGVHALGLATSSDGVTWKRNGDKPIFERSAPGRSASETCPNMILKDIRTMKGLVCHGMSSSTGISQAYRCNGLCATVQRAVHKHLVPGRTCSFRHMHGGRDDCSRWQTHVSANEKCTHLTPTYFSCLRKWKWFSLPTKAKAVTITPPEEVVSRPKSCVLVSMRRQ